MVQHPGLQGTPMVGGVMAPQAMQHHDPGIQDKSAQMLQMMAGGSSKLPENMYPMLPTGLPPHGFPNPMFRGQMARPQQRFPNHYPNQNAIPFNQMNLAQSVPGIPVQGNSSPVNPSAYMSGWEDAKRRKLYKQKKTKSTSSVERNSPCPNVDVRQIPQEYNPTPLMGFQQGLVGNTSPQTNVPCTTSLPKSVPSFLEDPSGYLAQQTAMLQQTISQQKTVVLPPCQQSTTTESQSIKPVLPQSCMPISSNPSNIQAFPHNPQTNPSFPHMNRQLINPNVPASLLSAVSAPAVIPLPTNVSTQSWHMNPSVPISQVIPSCSTTNTVINQPAIMTTESADQQNLTVNPGPSSSSSSASMPDSPCIPPIENIKKSAEESSMVYQAFQQQQQIISGHPQQLVIQSEVQQNSMVYQQHQITNQQISMKTNTPTPPRVPTPQLKPVPTNITAPNTETVTSVSSTTTPPTSNAQPVKKCTCGANNSSPEPSTSTSSEVVKNVSSPSIVSKPDSTVKSTSTSSSLTSRITVSNPNVAVIPPLPHSMSSPTTKITTNTSTVFLSGLSTFIQQSQVLLPKSTVTTPVQPIQIQSQSNTPFASQSRFPMIAPNVPMQSGILSKQVMCVGGNNSNQILMTSAGPVLIPMGNIVPQGLIQQPAMPPMSIPNVTNVTTSMTQVVPAVGMQPQIIGQQQVMPFVNTLNSVQNPLVIQNGNVIQNPQAFTIDGSGNVNVAMPQGITLSPGANLTSPGGNVSAPAIQIPGLTLTGNLIPGPLTPLNISDDGRGLDTSLDSTSSNGSSRSSSTPSLQGTSPGDSPPSGGKKKSRKRKSAPPSQVTPPILAVNPQTSPLLMPGNVNNNMVPNMQGPLVQMVTILPGGKQQMVLNPMDATQLNSNTMQQFGGLGIGSQMIASSGSVFSNVPASGVNLNGQIISNTMNMNSITQNTVRPVLGNQMASLNATQLNINPNQPTQMNSNQVNVMQPVNIFANNGPSTVI